MTNGKEEKYIDEYLREMMGVFTDEEKKEAAKAGFKNLGIEVSNCPKDLKQNPESPHKPNLIS